MTAIKQNSVVIFDIDSTLADVDHRLHHLKPNPGEKKNWKRFFTESKHDSVIPHTKALTELYIKSGYDVFLITGRPENYRLITLEWLLKHNIPFNTLLMRPTDNHLPDYEVKADLYKQHLLHRDVEVAFEDRIPVAKKWVELGIPVLLCGFEWMDE